MKITDKEMAKDSETNLQELKDFVQRYCEDRDWGQFHNAKDLATALIIESAELLEHFRYKSEKEVEELFKNPEKREHISEEMTDVLFPLLRLAQKYNVDLADVFKRKMEKNAKKYPIDKAKGSNKKYSEL